MLESFNCLKFIGCQAGHLGCVEGMTENWKQKRCPDRRRVTINHIRVTFVKRHGISCQYLGHPVLLLVTTSLAFSMVALPLHAVELTPVPSQPMLPAWEQQSAPANPPTHDYKVTVVIVRGNRRISTSTLRAQISIRHGNTYEPGKVERDVTALRNTGYFDDVRAETKDDPKIKDGKIVTFFVREKKELVQPKTP